MYKHIHGIHTLPITGLDRLSTVAYLRKKKHFGENQWYHSPGSQATPREIKSGSGLGPRLFKKDHSKKDHSKKDTYFVLNGVHFHCMHTTKKIFMRLTVSGHEHLLFAQIAPKSS